MLCLARRSKHPHGHTFPASCTVWCERAITPTSHRSNAVTTNLDASSAALGDLACHQTAKPPPTGVLDLEGLRNRCMGNIDLVQRVLKTFQQRIPEEIEAMAKALECKDAEQIARVAHRVKGSSASVSAGGLFRAATELEAVSRKGCVTDIPAGIEHLRDEWETYLDYAVALLSAADTAQDSRTTAGRDAAAASEPTLCGF
jgi:HPt (histidine-containing phosphotransfer) domain-containing protein